MLPISGWYIQPLHIPSWYSKINNMHCRWILYKCGRQNLQHMHSSHFSQFEVNVEDWHSCTTFDWREPSQDAICSSIDETDVLSEAARSTEPFSLIYLVYLRCLSTQRWVKSWYLFKNVCFTGSNHAIRHICWVNFLEFKTFKSACYKAFLWRMQYADSEDNLAQTVRW